MKKLIIVSLSVFIAVTVFAEKIKIIPIVVTTNKIVNQTATPTVVLPAPVSPPPPQEETATPSWLIATPTSDVGGNQ